MQLVLVFLAIKQTFSCLNIKTETSDKLKRVEIAFYTNNLTKSARLFLESYYIL
jgi:hypothetical protein